MEELDIQNETATPVEQPEEANAPIGAEEAPASNEPEEPPALTVDELLPASEDSQQPLTTAEADDEQLKAALEAIVYVTEEPVTVAQIANALEQPPERIRLLLADLTAEFEKPEHGLTIKEVAGGYKMATKPEHHETVRAFVKSLKAPLKLSLPALETLAVVAYKQPVTAPEIMEIRGVQGAGVLKTLLDRKLIAAAGRKNVIGKPILYKTTKEFLVQFGLKDLNELPSLKEFEEIRRFSFTDEEGAPTAEAEQPAAPAEAENQVEDAEAEPAEAESSDPAPVEAESQQDAPEATGAEAATAPEASESAAVEPETGNPPEWEPEQEP